MKLLQQMKNGLFLLLVTVCLLSSANAQENIKGSDIPIKRVESPTHDICYIYSRYIIISVALDPAKMQSSTDSRIVVKKRSGDNDLNCSLTGKGRELLTINYGNLIGLYKHFAFTEYGTGPDGRNIEIYDLEKKKMVYSAVYSPVGDQSITNNALIFYKDIEDREKKRYCIGAKQWQENGFDYGFEQKTSLDLDSLREKAIGQITCSQRQ